MGLVGKLRTQELRSIEILSNHSCKQNKKSRKKRKQAGEGTRNDAGRKKTKI